MTVSVKPTRGGAVFHTGTATWCALAEICVSIAPDICSACKLWYTNDGDGLDANRASQLADVLEQRLSDGTIDRLIGRKIAFAKSLPDERCTICAGSGVRTDALGVKRGFDKRKIDDPKHPRFGEEGYCNGCRGYGYNRPFAALYPLENTGKVAELVLFLSTSGGFRIW